MYRTIFNFKKVVKLLSVLSIALLLIGCPQHTVKVEKNYFDVEAIANSSYYLSQARQSIGTDKNNWLLLAARALLREGDITSADKLLITLSSNLTTAQGQEYQLLLSELHIRQNDLSNAQQSLNKISITNLSDSQKRRYYQAKVAISRLQPLEQLRAYIELEKFGTLSQRHAVINDTWHMLSQLPRSILNQSVIYANEYTLQGWLDLLRVQQDNKDNIQQLQSAVREWQVHYANNPAAKYLPRTIFGEEYRLPEETEMGTLALFLPLTGQYRVLGEAILSGFKDSMVPQDEELTLFRSITLEQQMNAHLKIYDTASKPLRELISQAEQDGIKLIIGPLIKNEVEEIAKIDLPIPVLALNEPEQIISKANLCYFSMSPEDEARDAARYIQSQRKLIPLVLVPRGKFGERIAKAFAEQWQQNNKEEALVQYFGSYNELKQLMNEGVGIELSGEPILKEDIPLEQETDAIPLMLLQLDETTDKPEPAAIDAIYVVAQQNELTLIKPMLDMKPRVEDVVNDEDSDGVVVGNIAVKPVVEEVVPKVEEKITPPIYASSRSHSAGAGTDFRFEMEGVRFSDIPLLAGDYPQIMEMLPDYMKEDYKLIRLYAMGMDAWHLAKDYSTLHTDRNYYFNGKTGLITVNDECIVQLKPKWQRYRRGELLSVH